MAKVSYFLLTVARDAIRELSSKELPIKTSLQILKNNDKIGTEFKTYLEMAKTIDEKYQKPECLDDKGTLTKEFQSKKIDDMRELNQTEIEIDFKPLSLKALETDKVKLSSTTIGVLIEIGFIINDVEEDTK